MADLKFSTDLAWKGTGRTGEGTVNLAGRPVTYSAPATMGGQGVGTSPEELLIAAVGACYSGTLFALLQRADLAVQQVEVNVEGTVTEYPVKSKFAELRVNPTILGGNPKRQEEYIAAAKTARDKCFIGKTITGNVAYEVGDVRVIAE